MNKILLAKSNHDYRLFGRQTFEFRIEDETKDFETTQSFFEKGYEDYCETELWFNFFYRTNENHSIDFVVENHFPHKGRGFGNSKISGFYIFDLQP